MPSLREGIEFGWLRLHRAPAELRPMPGLRCRMALCTLESNDAQRSAHRRTGEFLERGGGAALHILSGGEILTRRSGSIRRLD